jgi:hypothetical protein
MENDQLVEIEILCTHYSIEPSFIDILSEYGLLEMMTRDEHRFIEKERLSDLERLIHLHYDLEINMEGIDTITHLLERVNELHNELNQLRNRLRLYENS